MKRFILLTVFTAVCFLSFAQEDSSNRVEHIFDTIYYIPTTDVKNQAASGTCWSFATTSFLESELLKTTGKSYDLSEMYFVRCTYIEKADRYIRRHGITNFGPGGQAHDVTDLLAKYGALSEASYTGLMDDNTHHNHFEMDAVLEAYVKTILKKKGGALNTNWNRGYNALLDAYLGELPAVTNDSLDPIKFAAALPLKAENFIEFTSFTHHPFYSEIVLEIPDNWSDGSYYNIPVDKLMEITIETLKNGHSIVWDGDVSNKGWDFRAGVAIVPDEDLSALSRKEKSEKLSFIIEEKLVDQEYRQKKFDEIIMTDDHLMHLVGMVKDQNGTRYFIIKNSWGSSSNKYGGYIFMSENYFKLNTVAIMLNKDALANKSIKELKLNK